jgi:dCMP deaminase
MRPSWDEVWINVADAVAARSKCDKLGVGAVITTPQNRIVATGYNGPPRGWPDAWSCKESCPRYTFRGEGENSYFGCPSIHAEANSLLVGDRREREGGSLYVSRATCFECARLIANSGVVRVVMRRYVEDEYREPQRAIDFLVASGITVHAINPETDSYVTYCP